MRGDILNSMIPIERNGEILGYIWANELTEDIRRRYGMDVEVIIVLTAGLLISLLLIVLFSRRLSANMGISSPMASRLWLKIFPLDYHNCPVKWGKSVKC